MAQNLHQGGQLTLDPPSIGNQLALGRNPNFLERHLESLVRLAVMGNRLID